MDAAKLNELVAKEKFYFGDYLTMNGDELFEFKIINFSSIKIGGKIDFSKLNVASVFPACRLKSGVDEYVGYEVAAHGSGGFFGKFRDGKLSWALVSTESDPFVNIKMQDDKVVFGTSGGFFWEISNQDLRNIRIFK